MSARGRFLADWCPCELKNVTPPKQLAPDKTDGVCMRIQEGTSTTDRELEAVWKVSGDATAPQRELARVRGSMDVY